MQRTAIPGAIFDNLQGDLGLLASQVTGLGSVYVYCYAGSQIFAGMLVDRYGGKNMGILGVMMVFGIIGFTFLLQVPETRGKHIYTKHSL